MIVCKYVVAFFFYSFLGYIYESIYSTLRKHHWQNRGFFYGPIIPIYGFGASIATFVFFDLHLPFLVNAPWWLIFIIGYLGSIVLEYTTSYVLEKIFHAMWWDYSESFLNINGRVCFFASVGFGVAAVVIVKWLIPLVDGILATFPSPLMAFLTILFMFLFGADFALTISALSNFQRNFTKVENEFTEHMTVFYDNLESSVVAKKDDIASATGSFIEKHETLQGAVNTLSGAKRGLARGKEIIIAKTGSLASKAKLIKEEQDAVLEKEVSTIMDKSSPIQKNALKRITSFRTEGNKRKITNKVQEKLFKKKDA